jgi:hypothetical protein
MKLKNIMRLVLPAVALTMVATSCHGDLDIMQDNRLSASNMWKDATDVTQSTYGIYQRMRSCFVHNNTNVFYWGEVRVGTYMWGSSIVNLAHGIAVEKAEATEQVYTTSEGLSPSEACNAFHTNA